MDSKVYRLCAAAMLAALSAIFGAYLSFTLFSGTVMSQSISVNTLPPMLAGFLFGPWTGAAVGAAADILKNIIAPRGAYMPPYTLTMALMGAMPCLLMRGLFGAKKAKSPTFFMLWTCTGITMLLLSAGLNAFWLYVLNPGFAFSYPVRLINALAMGPVLAFLLRILLPLVGRIHRG